MSDSRAGTSRVATACARRLAVAVILGAMSGAGVPAVVAAPPALAVPIPKAGADPAHGAETAAHGSEAVPAGGQGKKGAAAMNGKKAKAKKGKKGKGRGPRIGARLAGFGDYDRGGGIQRATGVNTANAPTISSPPYQVTTGRRNVNAPAGNSAVTFAGIQQVSSVSVFTDSLTGNCQNGIKHCSINQTLQAKESRGDIGR